ncbi:MAG: class I SAM-dependent methyltransferase [Thauera sp.]|jgi:SAM-dependent methyltransferase
MSAELYRPCPLCENLASEVLTSIDLPQPSASPLPAGYQLMICGKCDFAYADTCATQQDYDQYYREQAKYGGPTGTGAGLDAPDRNRLESLADRLQGWLPGRSATILDIGCGAGGLLQVIVSRGYRNAEGLEPDPAAVAAATRLGLQVRPGLVSDAATVHAGRHFDLIVMSHVVEHLRDLSWLNTLPNLLAPNGVLYVEVPDARGYRCGERPPFYYFDSEHINHFGPRALARLFAKTGLQAHALVDVSLQLGDGTAYPAIAGVAGAGSADLPTPPAAAAKRLRAYIAESRRLGAASARIHPPLGPAPVLVWGAGSWAQRLLGQGALPLHQVSAFLDNALNKQGQTFAGKPILSPATGLARHPNAQVLICIAVDPHQIEAQIQHIAPGQSRTLHFFNIDTA